jgi:S1-C subfamily serine protease
MTPSPDLPLGPDYDSSKSSGTGGWGQPAGPDTAVTPGRTGRHGIPGGRRVAAAIGAALVLGGGAGALATAVAVSGPTTTTTVVKDVATASTAGDATTVQGIVAKVEPALVDIETTGTSQTTSPFGNGLDPFGGSTEQTAGAGTGMIIGSHGLILTNAHVLEGASTISVIYDGQTTSHPATLVGEDAAKDVALIQVAGASNLPTVTLASSTPVQIGDSVLAIGNALNLQNGGFTVSNGIISALNRSISTNNGENLAGLEQTSAAISSGDSGGALLDSAGQVIGMNTASAASSGTNTASNIGFAIPTDEITSLIPQLEKGNIGTPTTGTATIPGSSAAQGSSGIGGGYGSPYGGSPYGSSGSFGSFAGGF